MKIFRPIKNHYPNTILKQQNNTIQHFKHKMNKTKTNPEKIKRKKGFCLTLVFILKYNLSGIN